MARNFMILCTKMLVPGGYFARNDVVAERHLPTSRIPRLLELEHIAETNIAPTVEGPRKSDSAYPHGTARLPRDQVGIAKPDEQANPVAVAAPPVAATPPSVPNMLDPVPPVVFAGPVEKKPAETPIVPATPSQPAITVSTPPASVPNPMKP